MGDNEDRTYNPPTVERPSGTVLVIRLTSVLGILDK